MDNTDNNMAKLLLAFASDFGPVKEAITEEDFRKQRGAMDWGDFLKLNYDTTFGSAVELDNVGGLVRIIIRPERLEVMGQHPFREDTALIVVKGNTFTHMDPRGPYFISVASLRDPEDAPVMTCGVDSLGDGWVAEPEPIMDQDGNMVSADTECQVLPMFRDGEDGEPSTSTLGEAGMDPENACVHYNTSEGAYLTFSDLLRATVLLVAIGRVNVEYANDTSEAEEEETIPSIPLAQYDKTHMFQNHDMGAQVINGIFEIAMGNESYTLPIKSRRSNESWKLTASTEACTNLLMTKGANAEVVRVVLDTVKALKEDPRASDFIHEGRVWFTVNKIAEEMLRTQGGTVVAKNRESLRELVDKALQAASSAQVVGTMPNGQPTDVMYVLNAERRDAVKYNGQVYEDVWGIGVSQRTIAEYADEELKRARRSELPERKAPFTVEAAWIEHYLLHMLNEARNRLYKTNGKSGSIHKTSTKEATVKRSWDSIFTLASPTKPLTSRQKDRVVKGFEDALTNIARDLAHDEDAPMYIRAHSTRDGQRGRGRGAYELLIVEASTVMHSVRDGSKKRGKMDLHG